MTVQPNLDQEQYTLVWKKSAHYLNLETRCSLNLRRQNQD